MKGEVSMDCKKINREDLPLSLKVDDVADILGISRTGAYRLVKSSDFPCIRVYKRLIIPRDKFFSWYDKKADDPL
jgi:hypothetical protein